MHKNIYHIAFTGLAGRPTDAPVRLPRMSGNVLR